MLTVLDDVTVPAGQHVVQFYEREENLALAVSSFLGAGLVAGETALVVATKAHLEAFEAVLTAAGINVCALRASAQLVSFDAEELLGRFIVDQRADAARFQASVGSLVAKLSAGAPLRIYGEMVAVLWDRGDVAAAMELESHWNELARRAPFTLFCAYPLDVVRAGREAICSHHSAVVAEPRPQPARADEASRRFEPTPFAAPMARRFVNEVLAGWARPALVETADLVVSELVSNAVRHGRQRFTVVLTLWHDSVRVAVVDPSPRLPTVRADDPDVSTGGRGMHLIEAVSRRWGTQVHEGGKTVWAEIAER
jgi:anti-sigma regulatory factor (Ser/Thr protein kinase)